MEEDEADYWTAFPRTRATDRSPPTLAIRHAGPIEPLPSRSEGDAPTVPDLLRTPLFGQSETGEELATYAILDAARSVGLVERMEVAGLERACLFKGEAEEEMADVAPWFVRLEEGSTFTRDLFTQGEAGWHLWGQDVGIYLRSRAGLDELRRHFRRFTRVQDRTGRWFYLRFYDPAYLFAYLPALEPMKLATFMGDVDSFVAVTDDTAHILSVTG